MSENAGGEPAWITGFTWSIIHVGRVIKWKTGVLLNEVELSSVKQVAVYSGRDIG